MTRRLQPLLAQLVLLGGLVLLVPISDAGASPAARLPTGTYLTKITPTDLYRAGLDPVDAHWEKLTLLADGGWKAVWFHPRVPDQPPERGRYVVRDDQVRFLGTPDTVRWRLSGSALRFWVVHVPDRLARLIYTAHPWRRIG